MGVRSRLKHLFKKAELSPSKGDLTDDEYYADLFIKSEAWNTPFPNFEEKLRWDIVKNYVFYVLGYFSRTHNGKAINILDLGCGRGWLTNLLAEYGNVTGIEPVKSVVDYGKTLFPQLELLCGTATDILAQGKTGQFDLIVCSEVIEHIPDDKKTCFLAEISLLLKKDGFLIVTTPRKDAQTEWLKYINPGQPVEDWLFEAELELLLQNNGFIKHHLSRFSIQPIPSAPPIEIYQLWLVQKASTFQ